MVVFCLKNNENTYPKVSTPANVQSCLPQTKVGKVCIGSCSNI